MNGARWAGQMLPRLAPGQTWAATAYNAVGLLAAALVGAGLVHFLAYHLPAGVPFGPHWDRQALALLVHCPLVGPLGLIAAIVVLAPLLACWELRRLERLNTTAVRLLRVRRIPLPPTHEALPRSARRLLLLTAGGDQAAVPLGPHLSCLRSGWDGPALFARPPPHIA